MLSWDCELRGRFSDPLTLTALQLDSSVDRVEGEGGEETVAVRTGVLDPAELGVNLRRVALVAVGAADPFIGGRVDVQIGKFAHSGHMVDVGVSVDRQQYLVGSCVQQGLDLIGVVDTTRAGQGLVTDDENRTFVGT